MNATIRTGALLALLTALGGCATEGTAGGGASVRAVMASQAIAPQPRAEQGSEAVAAVAAYGNYQRSYTAPVAQSDAGVFALGRQ